MKKRENIKKLSALFILVSMLLASCSSGNTPAETESATQSTVTEAVSSQETADTTEVQPQEPKETLADPTDDPDTVAAYDDYVNTHMYSMPDGFIPYKSVWFDGLGAVTGFEVNEASGTYSYTFTDKYGFNTKAEVTPVSVDDIDVYRSFVVPYEDGRTAEAFTYNSKCKMNEVTSLGGKTVTLDRTHYVYNQSSELICIATVYEGNLVEFTPTDESVSFTDYKNNQGFISAFLDGYNAARVITAGIYPKNAVYSSAIDEFIAEADTKELCFTDSVKASSVIKSERLIPEGYTFDSIAFEDILDYELYPLYIRYFNINLKGTDNDSSVFISVKYCKHGLDGQRFGYTSKSLIDEQRTITKYEVSEDRIFLERRVANSVEFFMNIQDKQYFSDALVRAFAEYSDEILALVTPDLPVDGTSVDKVTFSSYFELESLAQIVKNAPEKIEGYLKHRGYDKLGLDSADKALELIATAENVPLFELDAKYNITYYPESRELSVNYYDADKASSEEYRHVQLRYMPADSAQLDELTRDTTMPNMNLDDMEILTCHIDDLTYIGKWTNGTYGLIVSDTRTEGYSSGVFFHSVSRKS